MPQSLLVFGSPVSRYDMLEGAICDSACRENDTDVVACFSEER